MDAYMILYTNIKPLVRHDLIHNFRLGFSPDPWCILTPALCIACQAFPDIHSDRRVNAHTGYDCLAPGQTRKLINDIPARRFYGLCDLRLVSRIDYTHSDPVSYTHLRAHETRHDLVCRLLLA